MNQRALTGRHRLLALNKKLSAGKDNSYNNKVTKLPSTSRDIFRAIAPGIRARLILGSKTDVLSCTFTPNMTTQARRWLVGPSLATAVASIPFLVALRDTTLSFATVSGDSMTPTLQPGDVVLVRRRDLPWWLGLIMGQAKDEEQKRVDRHDWMQGIMTAHRLTTVPGEIVVVRNPLLLNNSTKSNNDRLYIKRVIGVGGQWLVHSHVNQAFRLEELPSYTVFVQGDNVDDSIDSRLLGPISRHLVVGQAEWIVWPPSRWQRLTRSEEPAKGGGNIRAVWSREALEDESDDDR
jgi:signal peptidase I